MTRKLKDRDTSCYNCPKDCHAVINYPGRQRYALKCFNKLTYLMAAHKELDFNYDILGVAQEYGLESKTFTAERVDKKQVRIEVIDTDRYGRMVGKVCKDK